MEILIYNQLLRNLNILFTKLDKLLKKMFFIKKTNHKFLVINMHDIIFISLKLIYNKFDYYFLKCKYKGIPKTNNYSTQYFSPLFIL